VAATLTRGKNTPEIDAQPDVIGGYDENHSEPARLSASNADGSAGALSNPLESG
jgi:hypothetical protein